MQAPLSSTASGQQLRTGIPPGLSSSPWETTGNTILEYRGENKSRSKGPGSLLAFVPPERQSAIGQDLLPGEAGWSVADGPGLAHDAGNLLGALRLYCDLLARPGVLREEHRHYGEELQLLSRRSGALIDRLLNPATTAHPGPSQRPLSTAGQSVVVPEVVEQCRGLLSVIARRAVEAAYSAEASLPVPVPRESLERILVNLTKNAAEASAGGGAITLRVSRMQAETDCPARIVLSVEDHGCGMSVAAAKVLLDGDQLPFRGVGQGENSGRPRGLGLRVVRELVRNTGGELRLKSQSGCGTTVEIAWAVAGADSRHEANERSANEGSQGTEGDGSC